MRGMVGEARRKEATTENAAILEDLHEAQVAYVDERPNNEASDGSNVHQPVKYGLTTRGQVDEGK